MNSGLPPNCPLGTPPLRWNGGQPTAEPQTGFLVLVHDQPGPYSTNHGRQSTRLVFGTSIGLAGCLCALWFGLTPLDRGRLLVTSRCAQFQKKRRAPPEIRQEANIQINIKWNWAKIQPVALLVASVHCPTHPAQQRYPRWDAGWQKTGQYENRKVPFFKMDSI